MLEKILCVDDDAITLMLSKKVIAKMNFAQEITTTKNGEEAIRYFDNLAEELKDNPTLSYPKLVFLDLNMPVMNGWDFLEDYIKKGHNNAFPLTKVIILSSTINPDDVSNSKKYPFVIDFLTKPISTEMLENIKPLFSE